METNTTSKSKTLLYFTSGYGWIDPTLDKVERWGVRNMVMKSVFHEMWDISGTSDRLSACCLLRPTNSTTDHIRHYDPIWHYFMPHTESKYVIYIHFKWLLIILFLVKVKIKYKHNRFFRHNTVRCGIWLLVSLWEIHFNCTTGWRMGQLHAPMCAVHKHVPLWPRLIQ